MSFDGRLTPDTGTGTVSAHTLKSDARSLNGDCVNRWSLSRRAPGHALDIERGRVDAHLPLQREGVGGVAPVHAHQDRRAGHREAQRFLEAALHAGGLAGRAPLAEDRAVAARIQDALRLRV